VFANIPIANDRDRLKCGIAVIDVVTGKLVAHFEFLTGVDEIFDVRVLPRARHPFIAGPLAVAEGATPIWYAPSKELSPTEIPCHLSEISSMGQL